MLGESKMNSLLMPKNSPRSWLILRSSVIAERGIENLSPFFYAIFGEQALDCVAFFERGKDAVVCGVGEDNLLKFLARQAQTRQ